MMQSLKQQLKRKSSNRRGGDYFALELLPPGLGGELHWGNFATLLTETHGIASQSKRARKGKGGGKRALKSKNLTVGIQRGGGRRKQVAKASGGKQHHFFSGGNKKKLDVAGIKREEEGEEKNSRSSSALSGKGILRRGKRRFLDIVSTLPKTK